MNLPFPDVTENIDQELNKWKVEYDALGHKKESSRVINFTFSSYTFLSRLRIFLPT